MKKTILLLLCLAAIKIHAQQVAKSLTTATNTFIGFYEYKPADYSTDPSKKYPLIIFLHGVGERGNGSSELYKVKNTAIPRYIDKGHPMTFTWNGKKETFLVLSPQLSKTYGSWQTFYVAEMIKYAKANLNIDTNRIILTGLSLGGGGVWSYSSANPAFANQLAAIAPICGTCQMANGSTIANANLPVWSEHAKDDPTVSVNCTLNANKAINAANPTVKPIEIIYPTGGHVIWDRSYDTSYTWHKDLNIYEWFLGQNKSLAPNVAPVARAGNDITIATGGSATLNASDSYDSDGNPARFTWRQLSGPVTTSIQHPISGTGITEVSGFALQGSYSFEVKVIDSRGGHSSDTMSIEVTTLILNQPPVPIAGNDTTVNQSSIVLDGTASYDDKGIVRYTWVQLLGPSTSTIVSSKTSMTEVKGLIPGKYRFRLRVWDAELEYVYDDLYVDVAANSDTVSVEEPITINQPPVCIVGEDLIISSSSVQLDGSRSYDDKGIVKYTWVQLMGPSTSIIETNKLPQTKVSGLIPGKYRFRLRTWDAEGEYVYDDLYVTVNSVNGTASPVSTVNPDQGNDATRFGSIVNVFPNPTSDFINIEMDNQNRERCTFRLMTIMGTPVKTVDLGNMENIHQKINIGGMAPGIYVGQFYSGNRSTTTRIIIQ